MFIEYNPNPNTSNVGDCTVRAIAKLTNRDWGATYIALATTGFTMGDMPSSDHVWGEYLKTRGYHKYVIPDTCPECYTVREFAEDHPEGAYALATGNHVVAVIDGDYYDSWDSGDEVPVYYFERGD